MKKILLLALITNTGMNAHPFTGILWKISKQ
jgi:hypothetical protein